MERAGAVQEAAAGVTVEVATVAATGAADTEVDLDLDAKH